MKLKQNMPSNLDVYCVVGVNWFGESTEFISLNLDQAKEYFNDLKNNNQVYNTIYLIKTQLNQKILEGVCNEECILEHEF
jgi:hypothetical protein